MTTTPNTDEQDAGPVAPADRSRSGRTGLRRAALSLLVLGLAMTSIFFAWQWKKLDDINSARDTALNAARSDAVAIASYDYRDIDAYFASVKEITTGKFAGQYAESDSDLRKVLTKSKSIVEASVLDAAIESATAKKVVVLIFIDQKVSNTATSGSATDRNRMRLTMTLVGERWLVSDLQLK